MGSSRVTKLEYAFIIVFVYIVYGSLYKDHVDEP